jgi:molybdopterin synthase catalytic subunit
LPGPDDLLKERFPLWKKELCKGGEEWIGHGSVDCA